MSLADVIQGFDATKGWATLSDAMRVYDKETLSEWKDEMDHVLLFVSNLNQKGLL